jgi:hypothetical protein
VFTREIASIDRVDEEELIKLEGIPIERLQKAMKK